MNGIFGSLTRNTLLGPEVDVLCHVVPQKPGCNAAMGGLDAGMTKGMEMLENLIAEGSRDERAEGVGGGVTKQGEFWGERNVGNKKGRIEFERRNGGALLFFLGNFLIGKRNREKI